MTDEKHTPMKATPIDHFLQDMREVLEKFLNTFQSDCLTSSSRRKTDVEVRRPGHDEKLPTRPEGESERKYACYRCGKLRTKDEGGTVFSVCEDCWEGPKPVPQDSPGPEQVHRECGCVTCICEDEKQCHGCGARNCGRYPHCRSDSPRPELPEAVEEAITQLRAIKRIDTATILEATVRALIAEKEKARQAGYVQGWDAAEGLYGPQLIKAERDADKWLNRTIRAEKENQDLKAQLQDAKGSWSDWKTIAERRLARLREERARRPPITEEEIRAVRLASETWGFSATTTSREALRTLADKLENARKEADDDQA